MRTSRTAWRPSRRCRCKKRLVLRGLRRWLGQAVARVLGLQWVHACSSCIFAQVPALGWAQIVAYFGFVEFSGGFEDYKSGTPGDYGWKVLTAANPEEKNKKLSAEIANGWEKQLATARVFLQLVV